MTASEPPEVVPRPLRVLFVCTANVGRSPYAERRARAMLADAPVTVASAGVPGRRGWSMDADMAAQLARHGVAADGHSSRAVTEDLLADADLVLTFEFGQRMRLLDAWPQHASKVIGFKQFVGGIQRLGYTDGPGGLGRALELAPADSMSLDIVDPHGQGAKAAAVCAEEIDSALMIMTSFLSRNASPPRRLVQLTDAPAPGEEVPPRRAYAPARRTPDDSPTESEGRSAPIPRSRTITSAERVGNLLLLLGGLLLLAGSIAALASTITEGTGVSIVHGALVAALGLVSLGVGYRLKLDAPRQ